MTRMEMPETEAHKSLDDMPMPLAALPFLEYVNPWFERSRGTPSCLQETRDPSKQPSPAVQNSSQNCGDVTLDGQAAALQVPFSTRSPTNQAMWGGGALWPRVLPYPIRQALAPPFSLPKASAVADLLEKPSAQRCNRVLRFFEGITVPAQAGE